MIEDGVPTTLNVKQWLKNVACLEFSTIAGETNTPQGITSESIFGKARGTYKSWIQLLKDKKRRTPSGQINKIIKEN